MTLAEFARGEKLSYWTLWDWKKRLCIGPRQSDRTEKAGNQRPRQNGPGIGRKSDRSLENSGPDFLPVRVVDGVTNSREPREAAIGSVVEVLLRCGRTVRFDSRCHLEFLAAAVSTLEVC